MPKTVIRNLLIIGDSMSDRGVTYAGKSFRTQLLSQLGYFPPTPLNRFTNGYVWTDHLAASIANQFIIEDLTQQSKKKHTANDLADGIIADDKQIRSAMKRYHLQDPDQVRYQNQDFIRSYAEGGLSNHDYSYQFNLGMLSAIRLVVPYLSNKIADIQKDDRNRTQQNKQETLTIIWSGANDLGLVNNPEEKHDTEKVRLAIESLHINVAKLIESGYRYFFLFNIPDAANAPYFANMKPLIEATQKYNVALKQLVTDLSKKYPHCQFDLFDIDAKMQALTANPERYHFDRTKLQKACTQSTDFKPIKKYGELQSAPGYMFWDTVHPTTQVHAVIALSVEEVIREKYSIEQPTSEKNMMNSLQPLRGLTK